MIDGLKPYYQALIRPLVRLLKLLGIHPNVLTVSGVILFGIGSWLVIIGEWKLALLVGIFGGLMDGLDGLLAKETGKETAFGAFLDSVCDRFTEILWIGSFIVFYMKNPLYNGIPIYLAYVAITGSIMVSYIRARAEGAGIECKGGILQRSERLLILAIFQFIGPQKMPWGLGIVAVFAYLTVFQRFFIVWKNYKKSS
jgi:CDP-diacylglycerol--glycerol-3-phosphate 3-phosphatidyltransferase